MPSPKSGKAGSPVAPAEPAEAVEADVADPGEVNKAKVAQKEKAAESGGDDAEPAKPYKKDEKKKSWIEVVLVDEADKPVPGEAYKVTLPDGKTVAEGTLDQNGFVRVDGIDPGTCQITFPKLDGDAWKRA